MVRITDFRFTSANGKSEIHCRQWMPEGPVKGVLQLVHGVAEYIERYDDFARFMANNGYLVAGNDHLGHGYSVKDNTELGWFGESDGWDYLVQDVKQLHDRLTTAFPNVPMVILGHSMGSFVARTYICRYPNDFCACILSGTGYQPEVICRAGMAMAKREIAKNGSQHHSKNLQDMAFGSYLKGITAPLGENDWICRDETVIRKYDNDPLCGFACSAGLMYDMMSGLSYIVRDKNLERMNKSMPVLFASGAADPVGNWGKGVKTAAARFRWVAMKDVTVKLYPDARHEILNEFNKQEVYRDILTWIEAKI